MRKSRPTWAHLLLAAPWFGEAMAGYLSVSISPATQCGSSQVTWTGDDGPYHLLLTPTDFNQHGYNMWIPEIPANQTNYTLPINQPAGASFLLTMWGKSGISFAGTSDVMTVGRSNVTSCFLTDGEILSLYTFSFNITDTYDGYPPQCGNLTMTWPTSLESNVTSGLRRRVDDVDVESSDDLVPLDGELEAYAERDESSSSSGGNTTYPPTLFGIIPLGNSFSIPITYGYNTRAAQNLPNSSLSNNPTTWTSHGVTSLNWTVEMAKGTRFILVAGIGSEKQWASGGSSRMLTVGQGDMSCLYTTPEDPTPPPSITRSSTSTPTATTTDTNSQIDYSGSNKTLSTTKVAIACVVSVLATLLLVGLFFFCRRRVRRRAEGRYIPEPYSPDKTDSRLGATSPLDTRLDLLRGQPGRASNRSLAHIQTGQEPTSPTGSNPFLDSPHRVSEQGGQRGYALAERTLSTDDTWSTPVSPSRDSYPAGLGMGIGVAPGYTDDLMNRSASRDALLRQQTISPTPLSPIEGSMGIPTSSRGQVPLRLHNRPPRQGVEEEDGEDEGGEEDITTLKRDTLAYLGDQASGSRPPGARRPARRRTDEPETEYVVHRDAGRVRQPQVELPPRYEELQWEEGEREQRDNRTA